MSRYMKSMDASIAIAEHLGEILNLLGLDVNDPAIKDTPMRVSRMYTRELFAGLFEEKPRMQKFPFDGVKQMVVIRDIQFSSMCAHHLLPFVGTVQVGYMPDKWVLGLSKFSRLITWLAARPQIQEQLTQQIGTSLLDEINAADIGVVVKAKHLCCSLRGAKDHSGEMVTTFLAGKFFEPVVRQEFYKMLEL